MSEADFVFPFEELHRHAPCDAESVAAFDQLAWSQTELTVLAHHERQFRRPAPPEPHQPGLFHVPDRHLVAVMETSAILYDSSAVFDVPGTPDLVAVGLRRIPGAAWFHLRAQRVATVALAQRWLATQDADPTALVWADGLARSTDPAGRAAEQRIAADRHGRYELVDHYTHENGPVYVLYRDHQPGGLPPYLAQAEIPDTSDSPLDYRVREARFATAADAAAWHRDDFPPVASTGVAVHPSASVSPPPAAARPPRPRRR